MRLLEFQENLALMNARLEKRGKQQKKKWVWVAILVSPLMAPMPTSMILQRKTPRKTR